MITAHDWYRATLMNILHAGRPVGPRGLKTKEVVNVNLQIPLEDNIVISPGRAVNHRFMVAEFLWMATGRADLAPLTRYNRNMAKFSDDGRTLAGAYGPWFKAGIGRAFALLRKDPDTRQAFVKIGDPRQADSKDVPCTMTWQFLIRGGMLHMVANMRSSDAWLGIPYDVYSFSQIANCIAGALNLPRGYLYLNLGSSHLYEEHLDAANAVIYEPQMTVLTSASADLDGLPPSWMELVLDTGSIDNEWFPTAAPTRPEFARLAKAMTSKTSAEALTVLTEGL